MSYSATYYNGLTRFRQYALSFDEVILPKTESWWDIYGSLARQVVNTDIDFAIRFNVLNRKFQRLIFLLKKDDFGEESDEILAAFATCLEQRGPRVPKDVTEHDELVKTIPRYRAKVRHNLLQCNFNDIWIGSGFKVYNFVDRLFEMALTRDWTLTYQVNFRRWQPAGEHIKWLRRNILRIEDEERISKSLRNIQYCLFHSIEGASFLIDEYIASDDLGVCGQISSVVHDSRARLASGSGLPVEEILASEQNGCFGDFLVMGVPSCSLGSFRIPHDLAASATAEDATNILTRAPPDSCSSIVKNAISLSNAEKARYAIEIVLGDKFDNITKSIIRNRTVSGGTEQEHMISQFMQAILDKGVEGTTAKSLVEHFSEHFSGRLSGQE